MADPSAYTDIFRAKLPPKLADLDAVGGVLTKAGVRGAPGVDDAQALLAIAMRKDGAEGKLIDLTAMGGLLGLALDVQPRLVERSMAALLVLDEQFDVVHAALPGEDVGTAPTVALVLSGDRGNAHTEAMLAWAHSATDLGGTLYLAGDKSKGFERYFKWAREAYGSGEVIARDGGMRVGRLVKERPDPPAFPAVATYEAHGLHVHVLPGVFSASGVDVASELLLEHLGDVSAKRVLDLGCGAGVLGGVAARRGAGAVTLLDDDLLAVESARRTLSASEFAGDVRHSDVASALQDGETFDLVVSNPPFHVGRRVVLSVAREFVRAAGRHLTPGGEMRLVANDFLPYEDELSAWGRVSTLARAKGFKVLRAVKS
ncbi:class I SAM-dependent methyltransferase [Deinococcus yavapaiensis]|uniref:16S rRNA (Guanine1207-N2)-methyltransferase n=1 Tax=Deinococcus yavapaiensis KR-236 TaxID=694435 RepID=A0A318SGS8_9DEIO|nr:class I SAM-dependent methyltransferase [Deinococcus yavapaiensis]PYE56305.1 16S rRNA (guanine1207-N2)-methyltransferase [Deinococcus yavapaiensis KR-236]